MKRMLSLCAAALCLTLTLTPTALAADFEPAAPSAKVCYPTAIVCSEDGTELKKIYDLSPEDDPAGIPRSDFRQDGFHYTLTDLLQQELPEHESRPHTETVSLESKSKDMESVLALLPQEKEVTTEEGFTGTLTLDLDSTFLAAEMGTTGMPSVSSSWFTMMVPPLARTSSIMFSASTMVSQ